MVGLSLAARFLRPSSVSIFTSDPAGLGAFKAFLLEQSVIQSPNRVRLDLTRSETQTKTYEPTRNPVQGGQPVSPKVSRGLEVFTVQGVLSANALGLETALGGLGSFLRRDLKAYEQLEAIADAREPVIVLTTEKTYPSMIIRSLQRNKTQQTGNAVEVAIAFEEIRIVSPLFVTGIMDLDELLSGAGSTAQLGTQSPQSVSTPSSLSAGGFG